MSVNTWYYLNGQNQRIGPVDHAGLSDLVSNGTVNDETLVWREGFAEWTAYGTVRESNAGTASAATEHVACEECGGVFVKDDVIRFRGRFICSACKPAVMQKLSQGLGSRSADMDYAGFWIRLGAKLLDWIISMVVFIVLGFGAAVIGGAESALESESGGPLLFFVINVLPTIFSILYGLLFTWKLGGTPGKLALGLRVVTASGDEIGCWRSLGRVFGEMLSGILLCLGYIIAAFDSEKRALHDHICGTRVIRS